MTCTEEQFLKDVASHAMEVVRADGVHRHLRFKQPEHSWLHRFDLVTWPGHLCITGDCGTYVFARLADMFMFFRHDVADAAEKSLYINTGYWAEKLQASDCNGRNADGVRRWSMEVFERRIKERYVAHVREHMSGKPQERKELRRELRWSVLDHSGEEHGALQAVRDFDEHGLRFDDFWEVDCTEWDYRFVWCLYAISWGIRQFDAHVPADKAEAA